MKSILHITLTLAAMAIGNAQTTAVNPAEIQQAVEKALPALQKAGPVFIQKNGCVSCHHQSLPTQTTAMAAQRGYRYDHYAEEKQLRELVKAVEPAREVLLEGADVIPQIPATGAYILMALQAQSYQPDETTAALVHAIALRQRPDGSWTGFATRPPISGGDIRETAVALHALDLYAPRGRRVEMNDRIARARKFLLQTTAKTPEESIARLMGLAWASASPADLQRAGTAVLALQRNDGGWAQLVTRSSDAYATGEALMALYRAGVLKPQDREYQRGVRYLLSSQEADGSWHVQTRAYPFQPLIDTGYPHDRDQWISAAGTSYAAMALMLTVDPVEDTYVADNR